MHIGRYRIGQAIGEGDLGVVYEGFDEQAGQGEGRVAIKVMHRHLSGGQWAATRLQDLANALSTVQHPAIVQILDSGQLPDRSTYVVTDYVAGESLQARQKRAGLPMQEALRLGHRIAVALAAAHEQGVFHLDLKPGNVLLAPEPQAPIAPSAPGPEPVRLVDTGLAWTMTQKEGRPGMVWGQPTYLAPEVFRGDGAVDGKTDVYGLGVMLYEMLAQRPPFAAEATAELMAKHVYDRPPPLRQVAPAVSAEVAALVEAMLAKEKEERPAMAEVANRLSQLAGSAAVGQVVGNYRLVSQLGKGGMGTVFAAVHLQIGRRAAIKVLHRQLADNAGFARRFLNEARAVNIVHHPGLVEIFEFGALPEGTPYIVMEFLEGESLRAYRKRRGGTVPEAEVLEICRQIALALAAAHDKSIIHRDLKPENVMLVPETPSGGAAQAQGRAQGRARIKVLDFGIAKVMEQNADATVLETLPGQVMGTPEFMAPEQFGGLGGVTDRADVYSLGVILYELLAGAPPFVEMHTLTEPTPPLRKRAPAVSEETAALVGRMLAKVPGERPSMGEVASEAARLASRGRAVTVAVPGKADKARQAARRGWGHWAAAGGGALAGLLLVMGIGHLALHRDRQGVPVPGRARPTQVVPGPAGQQQENAGPGPAPGPGQPGQTGHTDLGALRAQALSVLAAGAQSQQADAELRLQAIAGLGQGRDVRHRELIEPLLSDPGPAVQAQAAEALGQIGARASAPVLVRLVRMTTHPGVFVAAASALADLGDQRGVLFLREALDSRDENTRVRAALHLATRGDPEARQPLVVARQRPGAPDDLVVTIQGRLAHMGDAQALKDLLGRLEAAGTPPQVRISVAGVLVRLGESAGRAALEQAARTPSPQQLLAARLLASPDTAAETAPLFAQVLADAQQPLPAQLLAAEGLGACGRREGAPTLGALLPEGAALPPLRQAAAAALLQIAGGDPAELVEQSMSWARAALGLVDESWVAREQAVWVLSEAGGEGAVALLGQAMADRQPEVRRSAALALGRKPRQKDPPAAAVAILKKGLADPDRRVRDAVVLSLVRLGDQDQREGLQQKLRGDDPVLRQLAVAEAIADPALLRAALGDPAFAVRFSAARRLADLGSREGVPLLKEVLKEAPKEAVKPGPGQRPGPAPRPESERLVAYGLLLKLGEALPPPVPLSEALRTRDPAARAAVIGAAADLPMDEALNLLRQGVLDPAVAVRRRVAEVAAGLFGASATGGSPGLPVLRMLLSDPDAAVRARAALVVARLDPGR